MKKRISILGSTGSIGVQTLEVVKQFSDQFEVIGLSAGGNVNLLKKQIKEFKPKVVSVKSSSDEKVITNYINELNLQTEVLSGDTALKQIIANYLIDFLVVSIVGTASLEPVSLALEKNITIGLASKEILVIAGDFIMAKAKKLKTQILPIDSEHAALKQCLSSINQDIKQVKKVILTASGGPFWQSSFTDFAKITKKDALKHPNWVMGQKITIDSATLMNKGLEVIEAHHLFQIPFSQIEVIIHPESIIHAMAEFNDSTFLAQMSMPDMRFPIQYALTYPQKYDNLWSKLDLVKIGKLNFFQPDLTKFPLLRYAYASEEHENNYPIILNTANEIAVSLFLQEKISFLDIAQIVKKSLSEFSDEKLNSIIEIIAYEKSVRTFLEKKYV